MGHMGSTGRRYGVYGYGTVMWQPGWARWVGTLTNLRRLGVLWGAKGR